MDRLKFPDAELTDNVLNYIVEARQIIKDRIEKVPRLTIHIFEGSNVPALMVYGYGIINKDEYEIMHLIDVKALQSDTVNPFFEAFKNVDLAFARLTKKQ